VIGAEDNGLFGHAHGRVAHGDAGGGGGFGSLLGNVFLDLAGRRLPL